MSSAIYDQLTLIKDVEKREQMALILQQSRSHQEARLRLRDIECTLENAIPEVLFPPEWNANLISPNMAARRYIVNGKSVYLDMVDELGYYLSPYWEVYNGEDTFRCPMMEVESLIALVAG